MQACVSSAYGYENTEHIGYLETLIQNLCHIDDPNSPLDQAIKHHFSAGGSRIRARLTFQVSLALSLSKLNAGYLGCVPELLHNASLVHDDIQDQDASRRGAASLWKAYGSDVAICTGDFLISAAYAALAHIQTDNLPALISHTHACVGRVIRGQVDDITQDKMQSLEDIDLYETISAAKSGPLMTICMGLPLIVANREDCLECAHKVMQHFAMSYQIYDDMKDVGQDQAKIGKVSGVNIVSIMQKYQNHSAMRAAAQLGLQHLEHVRHYAQDLPKELRVILHDHVTHMIQKINELSVN